MLLHWVLILQELLELCQFEGLDLSWTLALHQRYFMVRASVFASQLKFPFIRPISV